MASLLSLLDTPEPPHITMKPRTGTRSIQEINAQLDPLLAAPDLDPHFCQLSRAAIYLWHDHFEAAHQLAQDVESADGSLLHGILHRREPDFMNARYWFRRVGPAHPSYECVVGKIKIAVMAGKAELIIKQILPKDKWQPLVFVDFLEDVLRRHDEGYDTLLRQIQAAELHCYLQTLPSRVAPILPKNAWGPPSV
jgi:hypothetical protein